MGVRVDVNVATAAATKGAGSRPAGAGKKTDLTEGLQQADFGQALRKAQPRKTGKAEESAPQEPVAPEGAEKSKPAAKGGKVDKKQGKKACAEGEGEGDVRVERQGGEKKVEKTDVEGEGEAVDAVEGTELVEEEQGVVVEDPELLDGQVVVDGTAAAPVQFEVTDARAAVAVEGVVAEAVEEVAPAAVNWKQPNVAAVGADDGGDEEGNATASVSADDESTLPQPIAEGKVTVRPVERGERARGEGQDLTGDEAVVAEQPAVDTEVRDAKPIERFAELFEAVAEPELLQNVEVAADQGGVGPVTDPAAPSHVLTDGGNLGQTLQVDDVKGAERPAPVATEARFAEVNHPRVVTAVKTQLLPDGGTIQLRLDPPDLGPLRLEVTMQGGQMSASFVAAGDRAASLLTHTLGELKHALEVAGVQVDKLQVRQGSAEQFSQDGEQQRQQAGDQSSARQEQQRREMLERMWRKVAGGDPLDLVA